MTSEDPEVWSRRFRRQIRFAPLGEEGQLRLRKSRIAVVGTGALGSVIAERLVRAGVGWLRLIDRDWVELDNLPRQTLYTERDVEEHQPKAIAAQHHLRSISSATYLEAHVEDLTWRNADRLLSGVDMILDGSDNFEVRYLINDYCNEHQLPWVHGGCLGASGQVMLIVPRKTVCFRCLVPDPPDAGTMESCDTAGVLGPAVGIVASWQAIEAIRYLSGQWKEEDASLLAIDAWAGDVRRLRFSRLLEGERCPSCRGDRSFLEGKYGTTAVVLCGRDSIQIHPSSSTNLDLQGIAVKVAALGRVNANPFFVRVECDCSEEPVGAEMSFRVLTIFRDGRAVIGGTSDEKVARAIYARWVGC